MEFSCVTCVQHKSVWAPSRLVLDVGNLGTYTENSARNAVAYRQHAFDKLRVSGLRLRQIPFLYWLRLYLFGIIVFAADYFLLGAEFEKVVSGFVDALYLSAVTVTTLGYGDFVPTSRLTKFLTGLQAVSGVVLMGLFLNSLFSDRNPR